MISRLIATNVSKLQNNYGKTLELNFELNRSHDVTWSACSSVKFVRYGRYTGGCRLLLLITRCAYAQGGLSVWVRLYIYMCVCVCVCRQKTRLFAVLPLENRHEITLYRSASQFIFFERCLHSKNRGGHIPPKSSHTASVTSHQGGLGVNSPPKRWWDLSRTTAKWERHTAKAEQGCVRIENGCTACRCVLRCCQECC